jgi:peptidoglycan/LPS O-acetylase OafA/YrhL
VTIDWAIRKAAGRLLNFHPHTRCQYLELFTILWEEVFLNRSSHSIACSFPLKILLAVTAASLSYCFVEQPFLRLRARIERDRERSLPPAALGTGMPCVASLPYSG